MDFHKRIFIFATVLFLALPVKLFAGSCEKNSKIIGFSKVKSLSSKKSSFFKTPKACVGEESKCENRRPGFLVPGNFVQVAQSENGFVCVFFRNFDGYGGRLSFGWLAAADLEEVKTKLNTKDLIGDWTQMKCGAGDDCGITISEGENKALEVTINSHINDHPGAMITITKVVEASNKLELIGEVSGEAKTPKKMSLIYNAANLPPGSISLIGDESFAGVYLK